MSRDDSSWLSCVGDGWADIVQSALDDVRAIDPSIEISQVKEKFGGLRIYTTGSGENWRPVQDRIAKAEAEASKTCEDCGFRGFAYNVGYWMRTLCERCFLLAEQRRKEKWSEYDSDPEED